MSVIAVPKCCIDRETWYGRSGTGVQQDLRVFPRTERRARGDTTKAHVKATIGATIDPTWDP